MLFDLDRHSVSQARRCEMSNTSRQITISIRTFSTRPRSCLDPKIKNGTKVAFGACVLGFLKREFKRQDTRTPIKTDPSARHKAETNPSRTKKRISLAFLASWRPGDFLSEVSPFLNFRSRRARRRTER